MWHLISLALKSYFCQKFSGFIVYLFLCSHLELCRRKSNVLEHCLMGEKIESLEDHPYFPVQFPRIIALTGNILVIINDSAVVRGLKHIDTAQERTFP